MEINQNNRQSDESGILSKKEQRLAMKKAIRELSTTQRLVKRQRKTVNYLSTERELGPAMAQKTASLNKVDLRHLFIAYGFLRGKTIDQIEPCRKTGFKQERVDQILHEYATKTVHFGSSGS